MGKSILYGIAAMIGFTLLNVFVMVPLFSLWPGGDAVTLSYHLFTYGGLALLCGVVVTCTHIVVKKIDSIQEKNKEEK